MGPIQITLLILGVSLVVAVAAFLAGTIYRKKVAEREIGSAEEEATRIINEAIRGGESKKKEMLLEAKDEIHKSRTEYEKEVKERRSELSKQERVTKADLEEFVRQHPTQRLLGTNFYLWAYNLSLIHI